MIRIITGVPGAGKTLYAVAEIVRVLKESKEEPRQVFTNIDGLTLPQVEKLESHDWREYPDGSLIVYDEAHQLFRGTGKPGAAADPIITDMDMHRHRGFDLWFISQYPTKIHHEIRHMADEHVHLLRQFGSKAATLYRWPESVDVKDQGMRQQADVGRFRYPRSLFKVYKSASIHTSKLRIPTRLKIAAVVVSVIGSFVGFRLWSSGGFASFASTEVEESASDNLTLISTANAAADPSGGAAERPAGAAELPPFSVSGCISTESQCRCYDPDLVLLDLPDYLCRNTLTKSMLTGRIPNRSSSDDRL